MRFVSALILACIAAAAFSQDLSTYHNLVANSVREYDDRVQKSNPVRHADEIAELRSEIKALRIELALLRDLIQKSLAKPSTPTPTYVPTRKVWRQVREPIQIEGGIDDGYELVEEPIPVRRNN